MKALLLQELQSLPLNLLNHDVLQPLPQELQLLPLKRSSQLDLPLPLSQPPWGPQELQPLFDGGLAAAQPADMVIPTANANSSFRMTTPFARIP